MTLSITFPNRGDSNPDTRTGGREDILLDIQAEVNALSVGSAQGANIFGANVQSSAIDITLNSVAAFQNITMTTTGKSVTLPDCTAEATCYDGLYVFWYNAGSNAFAIKANGGADIVASVLPGEYWITILEDDSTAAGTWRSFQFVNDVRRIIENRIYNSWSF